MNFKEWEPLYQQILTDFGFDRSEDERSAEILSKLIAHHDITNIDTLAELLRDKEVFIFGAGPSLEQDLQVGDLKKEYNGVIVTADGATSALVKSGIIPDVIVTDLDGKLEDQVHANEQGAIVVIHAHGDNIDTILEWTPKFTNKVLGTTQARPCGALHNFGGFTDGDRAVFLAAHFKASKINLVAFNFEEPGEYSHKYDLKTKIKKLTWANGLIAMINEPEIVFRSGQE